MNKHETPVTDLKREVTRLLLMVGDLEYMATDSKLRDKRIYKIRDDVSAIGEQARKVKEIPVVSLHDAAKEKPETEDDVIMISGETMVIGHYDGFDWWEHLANDDCTCDCVKADYRVDWWIDSREIVQWYAKK